MHAPLSTLEVRSKATAGTRRPFAAVGFGHFSVPLGLSGLAGAWTAADDAVSASTWVADVLWAIAATFWLLFVVLYAIQHARRPARISSDLRHPVTGPFAANVPVVGVLLAAHFGAYAPAAAPWVISGLVLLSVLFAAALLARWFRGDLDVELLHPGYFLPVVAAAFVGSIGFSSANLHGAATAAFGAGVFFWLVVGTVVTGRLITGRALPEALKPTLVVVVVPPAVGGLAWLSIIGGSRDPIGWALLGILVVLAAAQLMLLPTYFGLSAGLSAWTFTFPLGSSANFTIRWLHAAPDAATIIASWALLAAATASVATIAVGVVIATTRAASARSVRVTAPR